MTVLNRDAREILVQNLQDWLRLEHRGESHRHNVPPETPWACRIDHRKTASPLRRRVEFRRKVIDPAGLPLELIQPCADKRHHRRGAIAAAIMAMAITRPCPLA